MNKQEQPQHQWQNARDKDTGQKDETAVEGKPQVRGMFQARLVQENEKWQKRTHFPTYWESPSV